MFVLTALNISFYFIKIRNQIKIKIRKKIQKSKAQKLNKLINKERKKYSVKINL